MFRAPPPAPRPGRAHATRDRRVERRHMACAPRPRSRPRGRPTAGRVPDRGGPCGPGVRGGLPHTLSTRLRALLCLLGLVLGGRPLWSRGAAPVAGRGRFVAPPPALAHRRARSPRLCLRRRHRRTQGLGGPSGPPHRRAPPPPSPRGGRAARPLTRRPRSAPPPRRAAPPPSSPRILTPSSFAKLSAWVDGRRGTGRARAGRLRWYLCSRFPTLPVSPPAPAPPPPPWPPAPAARRGPPLARAALASCAMRCGSCKAWWSPRRCPPGLPAWTARPVSGLLEGVADAIEALACGPPQSPRSRSRTRSDLKV